MDAINKAFEVVSCVTNTAHSISNEAAKLPKTKKHHRNVFIKQYNRRPMNKKKNAVGILNIALIAMSGIINIATIQSQPISKYSNN